MRHLEKLANLVDVEVDQILAIVNDVASNYKRFTIKKGRTRLRYIDAPSGLLKKIQRVLLDHLLYGWQPHHAAHGFLPGRSIVSNAQLHTKKKWVMSFDIKDFFPSTTNDLILKTLLSLTGSNDSQFWSTVTDLCCLKGRLPQGAPTSPHLANLCFKPCDILLHEYATQNDLVYSRYADDITFSGSTIPGNIEIALSESLSLLGYVLASEKTKLMGRHERQFVTGLVVNDFVALPRQLRKTLRAIEYDLQKNGILAALNNSTLVTSEDELSGYLALRKMIGEVENKSSAPSL